MSQRIVEMDVRAAITAKGVPSWLATRSLVGRRLCGTIALLGGTDALSNAALGKLARLLMGDFADLEAEHAAYVADPEAIDADEVAA